MPRRTELIPFYSPFAAQSSLKPYGRAQTDWPSDHSSLSYSRLAHHRRWRGLSLPQRDRRGGKRNSRRVRPDAEQCGWFMGARSFGRYAILQVPSGWFAERFGIANRTDAFRAGLVRGDAGVSGCRRAFGCSIAAQLVMGPHKPASCRHRAIQSDIGCPWPNVLPCGTLCRGMQIGTVVATASPAIVDAYRLAVDFAVFVPTPGIYLGDWLLHPISRPPTDVLPPRLQRARTHSVADAAWTMRTRRTTSANSANCWPSQHPTMWWLCGEQVCRSAGYMFFASWFPTFLQVTRDVSIKTFGYLQGVVSGGAAGGLHPGGLAHRLDLAPNRKSSRISRSGVGAHLARMLRLVILGAWFVKIPRRRIVLLALGPFCRRDRGTLSHSPRRSISAARACLRRRNDEHDRKLRRGKLPRPRGETI